MKTYAVRFSVIGNFTSGEFPIDMLRYDGCYPADQESVGEIADAMSPEARHERQSGRAIPGHQSGNMPGDGDSKVVGPLFRVRLTALVINKKWEPTVARWASFGWQVEPGSIRKDVL